MIRLETNPEGTKIIVTIDAGPDEIHKAVRSASGKSHIVASTGGFVSVQIGSESLMLSLNLIKKSK